MKTITELRTEAKKEVAQIKADFKGIKGKLKGLLDTAKRKFSVNFDGEDDDDYSFEWRDRSLGYDDNFYGDRGSMETGMIEMERNVVNSMRECVGNAVAMNVETSYEYGSVFIRLSDKPADIKDVMYDRFRSMVLSENNNKFFGAFWNRYNQAISISTEDGNFERDEKRLISFARIFGITLECTRNEYGVPCYRMPK